MVAWPALPIVVVDHTGDIRDDEKWVDNMDAIFEHSDRIFQLDLNGLRSCRLEKVLGALQQPFPALTHIALHCKHSETAPPVVPESFLGGSAPQLESLRLGGVLFPGLTNLLLSATRLVLLHLWRIPHSGYISPETMVTYLSMLTRLEKLYIGFKSPQSRPDQRRRRPPPLTRPLLPVLTTWEFRGASEYLEELVVRIDAPLLEYLDIVFFNQLIFDTPQLAQFISRRTPQFKTVQLDFDDFFGAPNVSLFSQEPFPSQLIFGVSCNQSDWQLSFMTQMCSSSFPRGLIPTVENLYIQESHSASMPPWQDNVEGSQWLELLHPFTAVKALYIPEEFTPRIAPVLQELVGERVTEVLPTLQTLFLEETSLSGPVQEAIEQFVAARQLANLPIVVSRWDRDSFEN